MTFLDPIKFVGDTLSAAKFEGEQPQNFTDDFELPELDNLPEGMIVTDAPLTFWVGHSGAAINDAGNNRFIVTESLRVIMTARRKNTERNAAVVTKITQWVCDRMLLSRETQSGYILVAPAGVEPRLATEPQEDQSGRVIVEVLVACQYTKELARS